MELYLFSVTYLLLIKTIVSYTFLDKRTSHIRYDQWNAETYGKLKFKFKTHNQYGLLLYSDNSLESSTLQNVIVLKLKYAKLSITVQMGAEDYRSKKTESIGNKLDDLAWHDVELYRNERETTLRLDGKDEVVIINEGEHDSLALNTGVFFGGISDSLSMRELVDMSVLALPRFIGCMENIEFSKSENTKFPTSGMTTTLKKYTTTKKMKETPTQPDLRGTTKYPNENIEYEMYSPLKESQGVIEGCTDACSNFTCSNEGRCINQFVSATCDCVGTGYFGQLCTKAADSMEFKGTSYLTVNVAGPLKATTENLIKFRFKTNYANGLILAANSGNDHLMVELYSTLIRLSINLGGGYHILEINDKVFSDGKWHLVEIVRNGRSISLFADQRYSVNSSTPGVFSKFDLRDFLYVGGHPEVEDLGKINSRSGKNFRGCLQQIFYNGLDIVYKTLNTKSTRFKKYGNIAKGCTVEPKRIVASRETDGSSISKSGPDNPNQPLTGGNHYNNIKATQPTAVEKQKVSSSNKLNKKTIIWIAVGLVIGSVIIIIAIALIVHNVRNRYSDVIFNKHLMKTNNDFLTQFNRRPNETVIYTPRNGKILLEPELV